jgi:hypothetical protein
MTKCNDRKEQRRHNTGLAKVAVQCSADTFVVNQNWFSASTFVVKIATFAKPENVKLYSKKDTPRLWCIHPIRDVIQGI